MITKEQIDEIVAKVKYDILVEKYGEEKLGLMLKEAALYVCSMYIVLFILRICKDEVEILKELSDEKK